MSSALRFWAAVVPSFLAVAAIAAGGEWILRTGTEVRLDVRAPRLVQDASGRYVRLSLSVEDFVGALGATPANEPVWVRLERAEPCWRGVELLHAPPAAPDAVALRGRVVGEPGARALRFDVDRFYLPDRGADPTQPPGAHVLTAVVRVTRSGASGLADLLVDGEPWAEWNARQPR